MRKSETFNVSCISPTLERHDRKLKYPLYWGGGIREIKKHVSLKSIRRSK